MTPRYVKPGELLAIVPGRMHQDRKGFFWMVGSGPLPNERRGDVAIVHVRGELEHHAADSYGCAESYEGIRKKFADAYAGSTDGDEDADDVAGPPKTIVMVIDSPGGVVSGLNETVKALQKMRREHPEVRTIAYCNEMAASAAYALACSCERIIAPPSAIVGSIGVISTMVSQARKDAKDGYDVRLLTSGARKADGHPHAPLSDAAVNVEQKRVEKLADAFFALASKARGVPVGKIRNLEAGIFVGKDAKRVGLVDEVKSLDDVIAEAAADATPATLAGGNQTDRRLKMDLAEMIRKAKAALASEKSPEKRADLAMDLAALERVEAKYKKTEKHVEHVKTEEEEGEEEESAEEPSKESAEGDEDEKKAELPDDEDEDEDEGDDEDEKKSSKASLFRAAVEEITGMKGRKALGALRALAMSAERTAKDVAELKRQTAKSAKASLIDSLRGKYATKAEAAWLASQPMATVEGFAAMRKKAGVIVHTDDTTIIQPKHVEPGTEESLPPERLQAIEAAVAGVSGDKAKEEMRKVLVAAHLADHNKQIKAALNGAGRY